jgi:hypothetical protein
MKYLLSLSLVMVWGVSAVLAATLSIEDQRAIDAITAEFQERCDAAQGDFRDIDADMDTTLSGELTLGESKVYQIPITTEGKLATVLVPEFRCTNIGYAWCGTGGCGFFIIVDGVPYRNWGSHEPRSTTIPTHTGEQVVILYPQHGSSCETASDRKTSGFDPCFSLLIWNERLSTFVSPDGAIQEWQPNMH